MEEGREREMEKVGIVFVPCWGVSHFVPMIEAAKRLLQTPAGSRFSVTVLVVNPPPDSATPARSYMRSLASSGLDVRFEDIPPPDPATPIRGPEDISALYSHSRERVRAAVSRLRSTSVPVAAIVFDLFGTPLMDVAGELGVPSYVYFASTATLLALFLHLPTLHERIPVEFGEMEGDVVVPGVTPVPPLCMPTPLMNKKGKGYACFLDNARRFPEARGIMVNTFEELEPGPLAAIRKGLCVPSNGTPPVYPIGPVIPPGEAAIETAKQQQDECMKWLDEQPAASVVFLCFGSARGMDAPLVRETAAGLERSGQRFLWSLRSPGGAAPEALLPEGFLERTRERGLVWPSWVSQRDVLAHRAVAAFVTHCGWNSSLEGLWFGVPMLPWPLYAEQHMNAFQLVKELGVAVELKVDRKQGNFVGAEELERAVRCLMEESEEGKKVRGKSAEVSAACRNATEEGASSDVNLRKLAEEMSKTQD